MGVLSNELSSWRKNIVECKKGEVTTLNFRDTRPNVMLVMNPSDNQILCNLDSIPTENHYDFRIKNHYARLVGKPVATSQVYFMNTGAEDVTLQVYSIYDKNFDPSWLTDFSIENVNLGSESVQPIIKAITDNIKSSEILSRLDDLMSRSSGINNTTNLQSLCQNLNSLIANYHSNNHYNIYDLSKKINDIFNIDCEIEGTSFGSVLLNNEEPPGDNALLGLYNVIQKLDVLATKLDIVATKLDQLIAK